MSSVLVTGASKGFGKLIVTTLLKEGHRVAAAMRGVDSSNKDAVQELKSLGAFPVEIDVTDEKSVKSGVTQALKELGGIDVAINNAGIGVLGFQEAFTVDDWKRIFEVNVFGVQRVNRAVLPHMREKRAGLLIHISSMVGRFVMPFFGPYNASKYALEALADNYRVELSSLGIESVLIEPGAYATAFGDALLRPSDKDAVKSYGPMAEAPEQSLKGFEQLFSGPNPPNPQWVADAVSKVIKTPRGQRPFRTTVDRVGMGAAVEPYNKAAEELQKGVYAAFGMSDVLKLKTQAAA